MARAGTWLNIMLVAALAAAAVGSACGSGGDSSASNNTDPSDQGQDASLTDSSVPGQDSQQNVDALLVDTTQPSTEVSSLAIEPASATITVTDGTAAPVQFKVIATYSDGHTGQVTDVAWTADFPNIADVDASGKVTAKGQLGGDLTLSAVSHGKTAKATVTVKLQLTQRDPSISAAQQTTLEAGGPGDGTVKWEYPYDGTVFPRGLNAPMLMWKGSQPGDVYEIIAHSDWVDLRVFTPVAPPAQFQWTKDIWTVLSESGKGGALKLQVRRLSGSTVTTIADHTWHIASGSMRGTVYYWSVTWGAVVRIKPGADHPDNFLGAAGVTDGCTTCHTVSADGTTLVMGNGEAQGDSKASTFDLVSNTLVLSNQGRAWANPAVSPDGRFLVRNHAELPGYPGAGNGDGVFETRTGAKLPGPTGLEGQFLGMPAFSPDGSLLAFTTIPSPGSLGVFDYNGTGPTFANPRPLIEAGDDPSTKFISWPTLTPDGKWIIYARGDRLQQYGKRYLSALYMASTTQPGVEMRLANLNGDLYPFAEGDTDRQCSYEPTFAPIAAGGYYWLVFTSRRTYGSVVTYASGNVDAVQQLWVAAIDQNPTPGQDPSHPAFWLPGQEPSTKNMRGFWSLDPCKHVGSGCGAASECCSMICNAQDGGSVCGEPSTSQCVPTGGECTTAAECCGTDFQCINKHCTEPPPPVIQ